MALRREPTILGPWTVDDLEHLPDDDYRYEVWDGELTRMAPAGGRHNEVETDLAFALRSAAGDLGRVYTGDAGFRLTERRSISPAVAFVRRERLPPAAERVGFLPVLPDLAVEVRSPTDQDDDVEVKRERYLALGVKLVWILDPQRRTATVHRADGSSRSLEADRGDALDGEDVVPGFRLPLRELFDVRW
jgi:Uma2 family endonuclease